MPGREGLRGKRAGLPRLGQCGPLGKGRGAVLEDSQVLAPTVVWQQGQDKAAEGQLGCGWGGAAMQRPWCKANPCHLFAV